MVTSVGSGGFHTNVGLMKYDPQGNLLWQRTLGSAACTAEGEIRGVAAAFDAAGNVVLAADVHFENTYFDGTMCPELCNACSYERSNELQLMTLSAQTGDLVGSRKRITIEGARESVALTFVPRSLAVDGAGNLYLAARFTGTSKFGCKTATTSAGEDGLLLKLSSAGACKWTRVVGGAGADRLETVELDAAGAVWVGGSQGGGGLLRAYSASGATLATAVHAGASDVRAMTFDASGAVVVAGTFTGSADLGGGLRVAAPGSQHGYVAKYDLQATWQCDRRVSTSPWDVVNDIGRSGSEFVVVGAFLGTGLFGGHYLTTTIHQYATRAGFVHRFADPCAGGP